MKAQIKIKKAFILSLLAVFGLWPSLLPAGGPDCIDATCKDYLLLIPKTPAEADFNDDESESLDLSFLSPVTPKEADFNNDDDDAYFSIYNLLAPVTPREAPFDDE